MNTNEIRTILRSWVTQPAPKLERRTLFDGSTEMLERAGAGDEGKNQDTLSGPVFCIHQMTRDERF
jgi:hypothetical protein